MDENQTTTEPVKKSSMNPIVPITIIGLIVIAAVGIFAFQGQQAVSPQTTMEAKSNPTSATNTDTNSGTTEISKKSDYKDGTYTAVGDYTSPGGAENIGVTVTVKSGVIESSEVQTMAERPNTIRFQGIFKENYKQFVIGKNIDEVQLDKVAGSSLSPKGFNDALEKIKAEAKA